MALNGPETGGQWWRPRWAASWRVYWAKCRGKRLRSRPLRTSRWQTTASRTEWTVGRRHAAGAGCHTHYTQTHKQSYLLAYTAPQSAHIPHLQEERRAWTGLQWAADEFTTPENRQYVTGQGKVWPQTLRDYHNRSSCKGRDWVVWGSAAATLAFLAPRRAWLNDSFFCNGASK